MNHYQTLGIPTTASYEDIKGAWRSRVMECHPDRFQDPQMKKAAHDKFIKLNESYTVLIDVSKRRSYDQFLNQSQNIPLATPNYSGYQNADLKRDLSEIEKIRQEVFAESGVEFAKNTIGFTFALYFSIAMTIGGFATGNIIFGGIFLLASIGLAKEARVRAQRIAAWKRNSYK